MHSIVEGPGSDVIGRVLLTDSAYMAVALVDPHLSFAHDLFTFLTLNKKQKQKTFDNILKFMMSLHDVITVSA